MPADPNIERERAFLNNIARLKEISFGEALFYELDSIDGKTTALLTHVSIMMAILAIFSNLFKDQPAIRLAAYLELFAYLLITLGCLGSIFMVGPGRRRRHPAGFRNDVVKTCRRRRLIYTVSLRAAFAVTVLFVFTLLAECVHADRYLDKLMPSGLTQRVAAAHPSSQSPVGPVRAA